MLFRVGLVLAITAFMAMPADACEATKAAYDQLKLQMTPEQVNEIVGCPGSLFYESEATNYVSRSYKWLGPANGSLIAVFSNGKLSNKSQSMLQ